MKTSKYFIIVIGLLTCLSVSAQTKKTFKWIGGPTYVLHLGSFKILTDPMFSPRGDSAFIIAKHPTTGAANAVIHTIS